MTLHPTLRVSARRVLQAGESCRVKLPGKRTYRSGFIFKGVDPGSGQAVVLHPVYRHERFTPTDSIKASPQPRSGQSLLSGTWL